MRDAAESEDLVGRPLLDRDRRRRPASRGRPSSSGRRRRTGCRGGRRATASGYVPTLFAVSPLAATRSAPTRTTSTSPRAHQVSRRRRPGSACAARRPAPAPRRSAGRPGGTAASRRPRRGSSRPAWWAAWTIPSAVPNWPQASGPVLQWVRIRSGPNSRVGQAPPGRTRPAGRGRSVASATIASASARSAAAIASPSSRQVADRLVAGHHPVDRPAEVDRGRAGARGARPPRRAAIARRAYGCVSRARSADSARPIAATWPIAGAPRTTIWRIAVRRPRAPLRTSTSTSSSGSCRWSIR